MPSLLCCTICFNMFGSLANQIEAIGCMTKTFLDLDKYAATFSGGYVATNAIHAYI